MAELNKKGSIRLRTDYSARLGSSPGGVRTKSRSWFYGELSVNRASKTLAIRLDDSCK